MVKKIQTLLVFVVVSLIVTPTLILAKTTQLEVEIHTQSNDSLQQLNLPERLFLKGGVTNLNQITIVDKFGTPLPFEVSRNPSKTQQKKRAIKVYALKDSQYLQNQTDNISLKYDSKNRLTEVNRSNSSNGSKMVKGYLLDFGKNHPKVNSKISFELSDAIDTSFMKFYIDKSSNLKNWRLVSKNEVLAQLLNDGVLTKHNSINLRNIRSRYLRITFTDKKPLFQIYSAEQTYNQQTAADLAWTSLKEIQYNEKHQAYILDVSAGVNYSAFQIEMPPAPSIITGSFSQRSYINEKSRWSNYQQFNFINIDDGNTKIMENQFQFWSRYKTQLKLTTNFSSPELNKAPIWVKLSYQPQRITFFANGNWPYKIHLKKSPSKQNNQNNPGLLNTIKKQSGNTVGLATLGSFRTVAVDDEATNINWRKILLWIVLVTGVILMAWMAKNLLKQID